MCVCVCVCVSVNLSVLEGSDCVCVLVGGGVIVWCVCTHAYLVMMSFTDTCTMINDFFLACYHVQKVGS